MNKTIRNLMAIVHIGTGIIVGRKVKEITDSTATGVAAGLCTTAAMDVAGAVILYNLEKATTRSLEDELEAAKAELESLEAEAKKLESKPVREKPACAGKRRTEMTEEELQEMEAYLGCHFDRADIAAAKAEEAHIKGLIDQAKALASDEAEA